jgi:aldehyde:ferredoxin oxidoreductase
MLKLSKIILRKTLFVYGTTIFCEILSEAGALPINNFRQTKLDDPKPVSGDTYNELLLQKEKRIITCVPSDVSAGSLWMILSTVDSRCEGEYETISALEPILIFLTLRLSPRPWICNRYCMDTISAGVVIAFAFECFEKR